MASTQVELDVRSPSAEILKKKTAGHQRREELEKEVSMLQQSLHQEEKMHEILESVQNEQAGSTISIPSFLPPKMKELLAELSMVENETARLESQISQLQAGLKHEREATQESKSKIWHHGAFTKSYSQISDRTPSPLSKSFHERMSFETKALHFISKAIKGDYNLHDLCLTERAAYPRNSVGKKENKVQEELKFQGGVARKTAVLKPASPLGDPHHPTPKPRGCNSEFYRDFPPKFLLDPLLSEDRKERWQPNKLSENIMVCLNLIYVRLLRMSRAVELEKSGPILRSLNSPSSRSFRGDAALNSNLLLKKESRQQDPYGIFNVEESIPRDIGPYKNLVIFTSSSMEPKFMSNSSSIPLLQKLRGLINNLQTVDLRYLSHQQKLAFWINTYNACIMNGILQYGVPSTTERVLALMNKATLNIGGNTMNAQEIEHFIVTKRANANEVHRNGELDVKESIARELYGLESTDPNVRFALCCGTRSSPAVRVYTADGVMSELEKSKLDYLQASIMVTSTKRIAFPELLLRNMHEFAVNTDSLVEWVCHQLPTSGTLRKSLVDCLRSHNITKASSIVEKIPYDYEFQYLLTI